MIIITRASLRHFLKLLSRIYNCIWKLVIKIPESSHFTCPKAEKTLRTNQKESYV